MSSSADAAKSLTVSRLSDDPRIFAMSCASLGGGCLWILVPIALTLVGVFLRSREVNPDGWFTAALIALPTLLALWLAVHFGFRYVFSRDAVKVPGGMPQAEVPLVVDAPAGVIAGERELVITMPARCTVQKLGKCQVELYPGGLQIWKGPKHPEPRWQFSYRDLLQAESVDLAFNTGKNTSHQYFVRVIANRPRMAFLFGTRWFRAGDAQRLVSKLREHQVPMADESIDC